MRLRKQINKPSHFLTAMKRELHYQNESRANLATDARSIDTIASQFTHFGSIDKYYYVIAKAMDKTEIEYFFSASPKKAQPQPVFYELRIHIMADLKILTLDIDLGLLPPAFLIHKLIEVILTEAVSLKMNAIMGLWELLSDDQPVVADVLHRYGFITHKIAHQMGFRMMIGEDRQQAADIHPELITDGLVLSALQENRYEIDSMQSPDPFLSLHSISGILYHIRQADKPPYHRLQLWKANVFICAIEFMVDNGIIEILNLPIDENYHLSHLSPLLDRLLLFAVTSGTVFIKANLTLPQKNQTRDYVKLFHHHSYDASTDHGQILHTTLVI